MKQSTIEARLWVIGEGATDAYRTLHEKVIRVLGVVSIDEKITDAGETINLVIHVEFADTDSGVKLYKKIIRLLGNHPPVRLQELETRPSDLFG